MIFADTARTEEMLDQMAEKLREKLGDKLQDCAMIGIRSGGVDIAQALHQRLELSVPLGMLSISFYRDDFSRIGLHPTVGATDLPAQLEDRTVVLVDDVLYSGRTVRAALNEIFDFGRPSRVLLACLIDRSGHELPIRADVVGESIELDPDQHIKLQTEPLQVALTQAKPSDNKAAGAHP